MVKTIAAMPIVVSCLGEPEKAYADLQKHFGYKPQLMEQSERILGSMKKELLTGYLAFMRLESTVRRSIRQEELVQFDLEKIGMGDKTLYNSEVGVLYVPGNIVPKERIRQLAQVRKMVTDPELKKKIASCDMKEQGRPTIHFAGYGPAVREELARFLESDYAKNWGFAKTDLKYARDALPDK